jgi:hypothetical protein
VNTAVLFQDYKRIFSLGKKEEEERKKERKRWEGERERERGVNGVFFAHFLL